MPHINFNTPFVNELGEPVQKVKMNNKNLKIGPNGQPMVLPICDQDGNVEQETAIVRDFLVSMLTRQYPGDESVSMQDKAKRGKLARKVQNNNSVHYTDKEIDIIVELAGRGATTTLAAQLEDLISGVKSEGSEAS